MQLLVNPKTTLHRYYQDSSTFKSSFPGVWLSRKTSIQWKAFLPRRSAWLVVGGQFDDMGKRCWRSFLSQLRRRAILKITVRMDYCSKLRLLQQSSIRLVAALNNVTWWIHAPMHLRRARTPIHHQKKVLNQNRPVIAPHRSKTWPQSELC